VCVTFDDAFANLLDNALRAARRFGVPAMTFVVTGNVGEKPHWVMPPGDPEAGEVTMTAAQLREVARGGLCRIGSHTVTHAALGNCPPVVIRSECSDSKAYLEDLLGDHVEDLALPYGSGSPDVVAAARVSGYKRIYTLDPCLHRPGEDGLIGRFSMSPDVWRIEFLLTCAGAYAWLHAWRGLLRRLRVVRGPALDKGPSVA
jgi:peptidoglycan/xylan/chitin deacetylase (PgdA/CDA1 family)